MESRTKNAQRNFIYVIVFQVVNIIVKFAMRTVLIYCLGKQYLGINGVFTNVLTILSMTELGLGSAIVYDLYKPLKENDQVKIAQQIMYFKKIYYSIGSIIFVVGLLLIPFLPYILTDVPDVGHITLIYVLYLFNTASSYFFAQYSTLISAAQKNYLITKVQMTFSIIKSVVESVFLVVTRNYIIYLFIEIILNIISNSVIKNKALKEFPYLKEKVEPLSKENKKSVWNNAINASSMKLAGTLIDSTDNLIISTLISTIVVGIYSNYYLIISIIQATTFMIEKAVMAGIGDLCASEEDNGNKQRVFSNLQFIYATIYAVIFSELIVNFQNFITIWIGEGYLLSYSVVFVIVLNNYLVGIQQPIETFMYSNGLFKYFKFTPWIEAVMNLVISVILAKQIGLIGVLLGTTISRLIISFWYRAYVVFKYSLHYEYKNYWKKLIMYLAVTVFISCICLIIKKCLTTILNNIWITLSISLIITLGISIGVWLLFFGRTNEYKYSKALIKRKKND